MDNGTGKAFRRNDGDIQLTRHFLLSEFTKSDTAEREGIDNTPNVEQVANLRNLCSFLLEPIRDYVKEPLYISSGFRSRELNDRVGGVYTSQHREGKAADIYFKSSKLKYVYNYVQKHLNYDQMILYPTFIHISFNKHNNRREAFVK